MFFPAFCSGVFEQKHFKTYKQINLRVFRENENNFTLQPDKNTYTHYLFVIHLHGVAWHQYESDPLTNKKQPWFSNVEVDLNL